MPIDNAQVNERMSTTGTSLSEQILAFHPEKQVMKLSERTSHNLVFLKAFDTKGLKSSTL